MRLTCLVGALAACCLGSTVCFGQPATPTESSDPAVDPNAVEVRFVDRSSLRMVFLHDALDVTTRYGKLTVPTSDIRQIQFGLRLPAETVARIDSLIAQLGDSQFDKREAAQRELVRLKELAYPAVLRAMTDPDVETARRAGKIVAAIEESVEADKLAIKQHDTIITNDFTIAGRLDLTKFKARTPFFGESQLDVQQLRSVRWLRNVGETTVALDASQHGLQADNWLATDVALEPGMRFEVTASGTIDLMAHGQVGQFMATPAGPAQPQNVGMGMVVRGRGYPPGTLLGRIGAGGEVFVIGASYKGVAKAEGKLYLRSAPGTWNNPPSGSYEVKIKARYE